MFNESTLVLEGVTLAEVVELVIQVLVDLACSTVLDQQASENTQAAHPQDLTIAAVSMYSTTMLTPMHSPCLSSSSYMHRGVVS